MIDLILGAVQVVKIPLCRKCETRPVDDPMMCWCPLCIAKDDLERANSRVLVAERDLATLTNERDECIGRLEGLADAYTKGHLP